VLEPHVDERISKSAPFRQPFHFRNPAGRGREEYLVYTPAGIEHPVHLAVYKWISADFRYLDIPYAYKDRNRQFYNQLISPAPLITSPIWPIIRTLALSGAT